MTTNTDLVKCTICENIVEVDYGGYGVPMTDEERNYYVCDDCSDELEREYPEPQIERDERGPYIWSYGHFGSGDPRDFEPDMEMCSPQEIERWKADKARAESGENVIAPPAGEWVTPTMHILAPRYGIGTYKYRLDDDEIEE